MKIDKTKLKIGLWYEDKDGNVVDYPEDEVTSERIKELGITTYHTSYPLEIAHTVHMFYDNKDTCRHPLKYRKRTGGWIKGIKGCKCTKCGKEKVGKSYIPFVFMKWEDGADSFKLLTGHTHLGRGSEELILAMVNSGDYTLSEAMCILGNCCERCLNVLSYKYLDGKDGYPEYSEEWKKTNTSCEFCEEEENDK